MKKFPERRFVRAPHLGAGLCRFLDRFPEDERAWRVLLAYLDETGEPGAYVSPDHKKYKTSPAFGYAGFVLPEGAAREFGARFQREKAALFATEIVTADHPGRWERKGASIFRPTTPEKYPQQLRVFNALVRHVRGCGGELFYYADEKPMGTPKQVRVTPAETESRAMAESLNRIARHADRRGDNVLILIDQINERTRVERLAAMYGHIFARSGEYPEMRRILEPPMHVDSVLSANVQFADWVAACVTRGIDYQLVRTSQHGWIAQTPILSALRGGGVPGANSPAIRSRP